MRSQKPVSGHRKGSRFEREVCRSLSMWISRDSRDDIFWRTAMSGGRATIGLRSGNVRSAQAGDVAAIDSLGERLLRHFVIDAKSYKKLDLFSGITKDTGHLWRFWAEIRQEASEYGKRPLLIARENSMPTLCLMTRDSAALFGLDEYAASAVLPRWSCYVVLFECFLREATVPAPDLAIVRERRSLLA